MAKQDTTGWVIFGLFGAVLLWLLTKGQVVLHGATSVTFIQPDPVTGAPQFDSRNLGTLAGAYAQAVNPICDGGKITAGPADPTTCSCPQGTTLWHDIGGGAYLCMPNNS